jgi:hypothetical protein
MRRTLAVAGLTGALLSGGAAGVLLGNPMLTGAQTDGTTTTAPPTSTSEAIPAPGTPDEARSHWMADALAPLVSDGTISQAQADAVIAALEAAKPERGHHAFGLFGQGLEAAAEALGLSEEEVLTALRDGTTLGELADQQDVDRPVLVDAIVAPIEERLSAAVADGSLTQEEADRRVEQIRQAITEHLDTGLPFGGPGGMDHGWGPWGHDDDDEPRPGEPAPAQPEQDGADQGSSGSTTS